METLAFSSDFNSIGTFIVHSIFGSVAGGLFALLYWQRSMQGRGLNSPTKASRPALKLAVAVFLLPTLLFGLWAYFSYLTPFFAARVSDSDITFEYRFPDRAVTVSRRDIARVVKGLGSENSPWVHLIVHTKDGRRFESAPIKTERFEGLKNRLQPAS